MEQILGLEIKIKIHITATIQYLQVLNYPYCPIAGGSYLRNSLEGVFRA